MILFYRYNTPGAAVKTAVFPCPGEVNIAEHRSLLPGCIPCQDGERRVTMVGKAARICIPVLVFALLFSCAFNRSAQNRQEAEAIRNIGEAYMGEGDYTKALRELLRAAHIYPDDPFLQNDLGLCYLAKDDPEQAIVHFKRALELNPDYSPAKNNLGSAYIALQEWDKAIACFEEASRDLLYATPFFPLSNLGYVYFRKGDYDRAIEYYRRALRLKPDFPKALHGLGQVYLEKGEVSKALLYLRKAASLVPNAAPVLYDLGRALEQDGRYIEAVDAYKRAAVFGETTPVGDKAAEAVRRLTGN